MLHLSSTWNHLLVQYGSQKFAACNRYRTVVVLESAKLSLSDLSYLLNPSWEPECYFDTKWLMNLRLVWKAAKWRSMGCGMEQQNVCALLSSQWYLFFGRIYPTHPCCRGNFVGVGLRNLCCKCKIITALLRLRAVPYRSVSLVVRDGGSNNKSTICIFVVDTFTRQGICPQKMRRACHVGTACKIP